MPTAENALIKYEGGQELIEYTLLTDSGNHQHFTHSGADIFSGKSGFEPIIRPNGLITGGAVVPAVSGTNNLVDVAGLTCYLIGVLTTVSADTDVSCTRATPTDTHIINSITVKSDGTIEVTVGTGGTSFSETRGAAGGPPLIAVGSIEIAQVRFSSNSAAAVTADEIFDVVGQHCERYDYPAWEVNNTGKGLAADVAAEENAYVKFADDLPLIHTGPIARRCYARVYEPQMVELSKAMDFKPVENTHSVSSTQYYGGTVGSVSSSIGQGGFTAMLENGVSDDFLKQCRDETATIQHYPDRLKSQYSLTQGKIGTATTFPVANQIQAAVTISAEKVTSYFEA